MKKNRPSLADKLRSLAALPDGPEQSPYRDAAMAFVKNAVALRAATMSGTATSAQTKARAKYEAALRSVIYAGPDSRLYFVWKANAPKILADHLDEAWRAAGGKYGASPPVHAYPKHRNLKQ